MGFYDRLQAETEAERATLMRIPFVRAAQAGDLERATYVAFLEQAYHHVKHTTPLLMATGARLPARYEWLRTAIGEYIEEEMGHQEWILDDITESGGDGEAVRRGSPKLACELMVAYAYDCIARGNPIAFFGMVHVLEGTSVAAATQAARALQASLGLPQRAFTYLLTHGDLDQEHVGFFESLMNRIDDLDDQNTIVHAAKVFYRLYGDVFRSLLPEEARMSGTWA